MPLRVVTLVQYLTAQVDIFRDVDRLGQMIVKAIKGVPYGGSDLSVSFKEKVYTISSSDRSSAVELCTDWAADQITTKYNTGPIIIVPVPNSTAVYGGDANFSTAHVAEIIAAKCGSRAIVERALWWRQPMQKAREGGPRFADQLYPHLIGLPSNIEGPRIIFDDVLTSGGHLKAAATRLREVGISSQSGLCFGRTSSYQLDDVFAVPIVELPDFDPANPWGGIVLSAN